LPASNTKPRTISPSTVRGLQLASTLGFTRSAASSPSRKCLRIDLRTAVWCFAPARPFGWSFEIPFLTGSSC
jgi:hypothetical protein